MRTLGLYPLKGIQALISLKGNIGAYKDVSTLGSILGPFILGNCHVMITSTPQKCIVFRFRC